MADITNNLPYFGDVWAREIYSEIFYGAPSIGGNHVSRFEQVKGKMNIPTITVTSGLKAATCEWTPDNDDILSNKELEVCTLNIQKEICKTTVVPIYYNGTPFSQRPGAPNDAIPPAILDAVMTQTVAATQQDIESIIWSGDTEFGVGVNALCDGFLKRFAGDGSVIPITATTLDASNIYDELVKVFAAIPNNLSDRMYSELRIFVSPYTYRLIQTAAAQQNVNMPAISMQASDSGQGKSLFFFEIPIVSSIGIPNDQMVASTRSNLWVGTDLISDLTQLDVVDLYPTTLRKYVGISGAMRIGTQYYSGSYVVYYS